MTKPITLDVSEDAVRLFGGDDSRFAREMYETAVVTWYDEGRISSGKGAELLGIARAEFLDFPPPGFTVPILSRRTGH